MVLYVGYYYNMSIKKLSSSEELFKNILTDGSEDVSTEEFIDNVKRRHISDLGSDSFDCCVSSEEKIGGMQMCGGFSSDEIVSIRCSGNCSSTSSDIMISPISSRKNSPIRKYNKYKGKFNNIKTKTIQKKITDPIELFNSLLNDNNPLHNKIKHLIEVSSKTENNDLTTINNLSIINKIYKNYAVMEGIHINDKCMLIMTDIYNQQIYDFTICFNNTDKTIKCSKVLLKIIPYFKMIFEDLAIQDSITLDTNYDVTNMIFMMLQNQPFEEVITPNIAIDIITQMDFWLMKDHFYIIFGYIIKNIDNIISCELENKNYDKLKTFYELLVKIPSEEGEMGNKEKKLVNLYIFSESFKYIKSIKYEYLHTKKWMDNIFIFNNWNIIFSDENKLMAIDITKKYDLLNVSCVTPLQVIKLLANSNFSNEEYYDVFNIPKLMFINNYNQKEKIKTRIMDKQCVITNYYPIFSYVVYTQLNGVVIENVYNDVIHIKNVKFDISVGDNILLQYDSNNNNHNNIFKITKIVKCLEITKKEIEINKIPYVCDIDKLHKVTYKLYFDIEITRTEKKRLTLCKITQKSFDNDCKNWI